jgi:hypothetical protein
VKVCFLLDENLLPRLKVALLRLNPAIDVRRVGDPDALPLGTSDPDVLHHLDLFQRILVMDNRKSMPEHLEAHLALGRHIGGLFWVCSKIPIGQLAQELFLIWDTTEVVSTLSKLFVSPVLGRIIEKV